MAPSRQSGRKKKIQLFNDTLNTGARWVLDSFHLNKALALGQTTFDSRLERNRKATHDLC